MTRLTIAGVTVMAALATMMLAPAAHADDQSFIADLAAHGITNYYGQGPERMAWMGHQACNDLRGGQSFDATVGVFGPLQAGFGQTFVSAAQADLCPDTLGR